MDRPDLRIKRANEPATEEDGTRRQRRHRPFWRRCCCFLARGVSGPRHAPQFRAGVGAFPGRIGTKPACADTS